MFETQPVIAVPVTLKFEPEPDEVRFELGVDAFGPYFAALSGDEGIVANLSTQDARDLAMRLMEFAARIDAQQAQVAMDKWHQPLVRMVPQ